MAITVTIGAVDLTSKVPFMGGIYRLPGLSIVEDASGLASRCVIPVVDDAGTVSISEKDTVSIVDGATKLLTGFVASIDRWPIGAETVAYALRGQDKNILLEETVVESESYSAGTADSAIIDDLFTTYLSSIDSTTYVSTLDASMEAMAFEGQTLRECLTMIAERTGGRFYIDQDDNLHYFTSEANAAAWDLSDNPNFSTTFPYENLREKVDATVIIDKVLVIGNNVSGWVGTGDHEAILWDPTIDTAQGVTDRGTATIGKYENGLKTYTCTIRKQGLTAGMDIDITNARLGLSASTQTVRRLTMRPTTDDGSERAYDLELGEALFSAADAGRYMSDRVNRGAGEVNSVDDTIFDTDAPATPTFTGGNLSTGVDVDADGHQIVYVQMTWGSVGDSDLHHYEAQLSTSSDFSGYVDTRVHPNDGDRIERFTGLIGNTTHYARVRAVDWVGNQSAWSGTQNITSSKDSSAPAQVTGETAAGARTLIGVTWTASAAGDLAHYEIQQSATGAWGGEETTVDYPKRTKYTAENFTEAQIQASTTFYYRIRAVDTSGNEGTWSGTASASLNPLGSDSIAANAIIANKIAANAIDASHISAGAVDTDELAAGAVEAAKCNIGTLSAITANMGTLTAGEIRVGTGSVGVDFTGFRIMSTYLAGYNSDTLQAGIDASDGKFYAGAGGVKMDVNGIDISLPSTWSNDRSYQFSYSGTFVQGLRGYYSAGSAHHAMDCTLDKVTGHSVAFGIQAHADNGDYAQIVFSAREWDGASTYDAINLTINRNVPGEDDGVLISGGKGLLIGETVNGDMTIGLTINQGTADDEIMAFKSTDIAHGMTDEADTSVYGTMGKAEGATGGLLMVGYNESERGLVPIGRAVSDDTGKATTAHAYIHMYAQKKSAATVGAPGANANLVAISSHGNTRFLFDQEGEMHSDAVIGAGDDWDEWDDLALAADLSRLPGAQFNEMMRYRAEDFERAGLLTLSVDGEGRQHAFVKHKAMLQFAMCCFRDVYERMKRYERVLIELGASPALLEG